MALENDLLRILVCPACRGGLDRAEGGEGLTCPACAKVYPIREGIPVMLGEEAIPLLEWRNGKREATGSRLPAPDSV
ncbi:Trm112 family protein [Desulfovibrio sp. OttesenSCG-928-I05]|nr:Trm112 family protein [Desulfovibrio sp. OttesenSCG-928-I05]